MSAPIISGRFMVPVDPAPLTDAQKHSAMRYVAGKAHDADDARDLLQALGLIDGERDISRARTWYGDIRGGRQ